ncbi:MAG: HAMP domain-containing histidine kinase [Clostridia bacterium]|nr:HAMP domain-containing histidine kinase [Clostridia bacterium]
MSSREIQRLRRKFILISMLSMFLATLFLGTMINLVNYFFTQREIWWNLNRLIQVQGAMQEENAAAPEATPSLAQVFSPNYHKYNACVFAFDASGTEMLSRAARGGDNAIEESRAYADLALKRHSRRGRIGLYSFQRETREDGVTWVALLDTTSAVLTRLRLIYASLGISLFGLIITFFLVRGLSRKAIQPEIENSRRQEQFITNASHELKTPLAVIRANTEMEELLNGESEWTQSTIRQVDRMNGLIQNLVMITRTQEQEDKAEMTRVNVTQAVRESLDPFEAMVAQEGKTMERHLAENVTLVADGSKLRQLTAILADNAIKYCDDGGVIRTSLEQNKRGRGALLTVANSYADGANVDTSRFFDRFYREDAAHNIDKGGYGIGLSIAESICTQCGGSIRAEWKNGEISFICQLY